MTPDEFQQLIVKKKQAVDAKYGIGAYEQAANKINPHRCAGHMNDIFHGIKCIDI